MYILSVIILIVIGGTITPENGWAFEYDSEGDESAKEETTCRSGGGVTELK